MSTRAKGRQKEVKKEEKKEERKGPKKDMTDEYRKILEEDSYHEENDQTLRKVLQRRSTYAFEPRSKELEMLQNITPTGKKLKNLPRDILFELAPDQEKEIKDAFEALSYFEGTDKIPKDLLKKALDGYKSKILKYDQTDVERQRIKDEIDASGKEEFDLKGFMDVMMPKRGTPEEEIEKMFKIFCGPDNDHEITKERIREICTLLGENMTDEEINDMLEVSHLDHGQFFDLGQEGVEQAPANWDDFMRVMDRTKIFY
ncbi:MAG: hypothetical protein MJ252_18145 [archaeon]|nr:hypothetical protein [archaeon]